jgi:hypothetical protein
VTNLDAKVLGGKTPNVDNGMWHFDDHTWIEVSGQPPIDLLFSGKDPNSLGLEDVVERGEEDGCPYFRFKTVTIYYADPTKTGGDYPYTTNKGNALTKAQWEAKLRERRDAELREAKPKLVEKKRVSCVIL